MSRYYEMTVEISECQPEKAEAIQEAAGHQWPFDEWCDVGESLMASAEGHLFGGETEQHFADRLAKAIWEANGAYCKVLVRAIYLENLPCEEHAMGEDDYSRLMGSAAQAPAE